MKIIPKFQDGGLASLFTTFTNPVMAYQALLAVAGNSRRRESTNESTSKSSDKESTSKSGISEEKISELVAKIDALPGDRNRIQAKTEQLLTMADGDPAEMGHIYRQCAYDIQLSAFIKDQYDKIYSKLDKNNALTEIVVDGGNVIVQDKHNNIRQVTASEYLKNRDKYNPLTYSNILYLRAWDPKYAGNTEILRIASKGISILDVNSYIKDIISSLGTSESTQSGYLVKKENDLYQGIQALQLEDAARLIQEKGMSLDGLYSTKVITKDLKNQAQAALAYIYTTLPEEAKTLLAVKSGNPNREKGIQSMLTYLISSKLTSINDFTVDYEGTLEKVLKSGTKSSSSSSSSSNISSGDASFDDDIKTGPYYNMSRLIGGTPTTVTINRGSKGQMQVDGVSYSSIPDKSGAPVGATSLRTLMDSGLAGITVNQHAVTFGDRVLSEEDFNNTMYNGMGGVMTYLPTTTSSNGTKIVDLDAINRWENFLKDLRAKNITMGDPNKAQEIALLLHKNNLDRIINRQSGGVDWSCLGQFLVVEGYSVDKTQRDTKFGDSKFVVRVSDDDAMDRIETTLSTNDKKDNYKIDRNELYDFNGHDDVYKGCIYIPITNNLVLAITAEGQHYKEPAMQQKELEFQMWNKQFNAKSVKSDVVL